MAARTTAATPPGDGPGTGPVEAGEAVAEGTFPYADREGSVTFEVNAVKPRGELLQMDYTVTPETPGSDAAEDPEIYDVLGGGDGGNIALVDMAHLKRYNSVSDEDGTTLEPDWGSPLPYDEATTFTAYFAAPRDEMTAVDVYFYGFPPILNVPVEQEGE
ncbi:hypothetical protein [Nocardiopsis coralliicola]